MTNSSKGIVALILIILTPILFVIATLINGFVVQAIWDWFMVPLGLVHIGVLHAAGIALLFHYLSPYVDTESLAKKHEDNPFVTAIARSLALIFIRPLLILAIAWGVHHFAF
jgi:hypothetical protein